MVTASTCWLSDFVSGLRKAASAPVIVGPLLVAGRGRGRVARRPGLDPEGQAHRVLERVLPVVAPLARDRADAALDRGQALAGRERALGAEQVVGREAARGRDRLDERLVDLDVAREVGLAELREARLGLARRVRRHGDQRVERDVERLDRGARGRVDLEREVEHDLLAEGPVEPGQHDVGDVGVDRVLDRHDLAELGLADEMEVGLVGERDDRHLAERVGQRPRLARDDPALPGRAAERRELAPPAAMRRGASGVRYL